MIYFIEICITIILSLICLINLFIQLSGKLQYSVLNNDYLQLFTVWTLFAPKPISYDFKIIYRDIYKSGVISDLVEIDFEEEGLFSYIFKSDLKIKMAFYKACILLLRYKNSKKLNETFYFNYLENYIKTLNFNKNIVKRQYSIFMVLRSTEIINADAFIKGNINFKNNYK